MPRSTPGVPGDIACGGYSVQPRAGGAARHEEAGDEDQHGQRVDPDTQHVHEREHHVTGTAHERDQVIAEAAEEQGGQQVDHHDHAVDRDELVIVLGIDERERIGETELQPEHARHDHADQADQDGEAAILDRDDLVVLAPDVLGDECIRIIHAVHRRRDPI